MGHQRARRISAPFPPWRHCGRCGCNNIIAVPSPAMVEVRWRTTEEQPPAAVRLTSPYELEARYCTKRDTQWVGYKLHLSETCEPSTPI